MRKFNLFDKVEFTEKNTGEKNVGCIVGFTTDEENGYVIDKESGTCVEPDEHAYLLLIGEMQESQSRFEEFMESELCIPDAATILDSTNMKQTLEEAINEIGGVHPDWGVVECFKRGFKEGAKWQEMQPMSQEQIDVKLEEYIKSTKVDDKIRLGQYSLISISGIAIDANSAKTTLSTEFTHKGKRYEAKMLITQKEV